MPQPIQVPRQGRGERSERPDLLRRRARDARYRQLIRLHRVLTRLMIERTIHGFALESEVLGRQVVGVEEEIQHAYPVRWSHAHARLLQEEATWWGESHDDNVIDCRTCRLLNACLDEEVLALPWPGRRHAV